MPSCLREKAFLRCPLFRSITSRIAFGHLPLLDDVSLQIEASERVSIIGRNGTGKSTLLQIISGELPPDAGTVWRQPGAAGGAARAGRAADRHAIGLRRRRRRARGRPGHDAEDWQREHKVDLILSRLELAGERPSSTRCPAAGGAGCCWRARWWPSPTCCSSTSRPIISTSTPSPGSRASSPTTAAPSSSSRTTAPSCSGSPRGSSRSIAGSLTSWPGDYATFLRKKEEWLANEAIQQRQVRQAPGAGGGLAAAGRQGAAHARRGPGARADGDARRARRSAAR